MTSLLALESAVFTVILLVLLVSDLRFWCVPRHLALPAIAVGFFFGGIVGAHPTLIERMIGAAAGGVVLWCVLVITTFLLRLFVLIGEQDFAMGAGDPLMLAVIGSFLGYSKLPLVICLGGVQGICAYLAARLFPRLAFEAPQKSTLAVMPFAGFMGLSALEILLWEAFH